MKIKLLIAGALAGVLSLGLGTEASAQRHPRPGVVVVTPPVPPPPVVVVKPARPYYPHRHYYAGHYRHHRHWRYYDHHRPYRHHDRGYYRHGRR